MKKPKQQPSWQKMTDEEILRGLQQADTLLDVYEKIARPIAAELARRKSMAVYGNLNSYDGELGCWEAGIDSICLHIKDHAHNMNRRKYREGHVMTAEDRRLDRIAHQKEDKFHDKAIKFERELTKPLILRHVHITGHF